MIPDLPHHNAISDWSAFVKAAKPEGVILKVSEGHSWTDPTFLSRASKLKDEGVPFGAYHFARPDPALQPLSQGKQEGQFFQRALGHHHPTLGRFLDWEATCCDRQPIDSLDPEWTAEWIRGWLSVVPFGAVYASFSLVKRMGGGGWPLWVADWSTARMPNVLHGHKVILHQYTSKGSFPGVEGLVDLSRTVG